MTTITYKDGIMACDSAWIANDTLVSYNQKIRRTAVGALLGTAGAGDTRALEKKLDKVKTPSQIPSTDKLDDLNSNSTCLLVLPNEEMWILVTEPRANSQTSEAWQVLGFDCFAIGSGEKFARAAMACGKSAVEAVALAAEFDTNTRLPIYSLELKPEEKK